MSQIIQINEPKEPAIICPRCSAHNIIDISIWREDVTKIFEDKCRSCGGSIVVGMLIISDETMPKLLHCIQAMVQMYSQTKTNLG
jgi:Zn ribbon nucleic-acid-binding protein